MNLPHLNLKEKYPLQVGFPKGGDYFCLFWRTYDEGQNMILSAKEESILPCWKSVLEKCGDDSIKIKGYWKISIVSPTEKMKEDYATKEFESDLRTFRNIIGFDIKNYLKLKSHPSISKCQNYLNRYDKNNEFTPESDDEDHYYCTNCINGYIIKNKSTLDLFLKSKYYSEIKSDKYFYPSQAPIISPNKKLHCIKTNFGHHMNGLVLRQDLSEEESIPLGDILFYFHGEELDIPQDISDTHQKFLQDVEQIKIDKDQAWDENLKKQDEELILRVEELLK